MTTFLNQTTMVNSIAWRKAAGEFQFTPNEVSKIYSNCMEAISKQGVKNCDRLCEALIISDAIDKLTHLDR